MGNISSFVKKVLRRVVRIPRELSIIVVGLLKGLPRSEKFAHRRLFLDCGSNLGQGFRFFRRLYPLKLYDYVLFEPNPNCIEKLRNHYGEATNITIFETAVWIEEGELQFFGLNEGNGPLSQGGSVVDSHNAIRYESDSENAFSVRAIDFAKKYEELSQGYDSIVLKMDIESAEYMVLPHLIANADLSKISHMYVEFHTKYMKEPEKSEYQAKERQIIFDLKSRKIPFTVWF